MAWDSTRPVPWRRLLREWAIYAVILTVVLLVARRNDLRFSHFAWLPLTFPIYLAFGVVLAKFGYQRKTLKDVRAETARRNEEREAAPRGSSSRSSRSSYSASTGRAKPAPTKRTSTGPSNRPNSRNKAKRR